MYKTTYHDIGTKQTKSNFLFLLKLNKFLLNKKKE